MDLSDETNNSGDPTFYQDWTGLHPDLLSLIVTKIPQFLDYLRFCCVCRQWRSVALGISSGHKQSLDLLKASHNKLPLLMIKIGEDSDDRRGLYSVSDGITYNFQLPLPYQNRFIGSSHGWLFCVEEREVITLLNPLNNNRITLPLFKDSDNVNWDHVGSLDYFLTKAILTADPLVSPNDYSVAVIYDDLCKLAVYKSGDRRWRFIKPDQDRFAFGDIVCYKSNIYGVTFHGELVKVNFDTGIGKTIIKELPGAQINYLVESLGELLLVQRFWEFDEDLPTRPEFNESEGNESEINESEDNKSEDNEIEDCETEINSDAKIYVERTITDNFKVFKFMDERGSAKWVEIDNIGEQALFVGDNLSVSVSTLEFPGCRSNSIYFTNQYYLDAPPYRCWGPDEDSGFFSLDDKKCHSHHVLDFCEWYMNPPVWFLPNFTN